MEKAMSFIVGILAFFATIALIDRFLWHGFMLYVNYELATALNQMAVSLMYLLNVIIESFGELIVIGALGYFFYRMAKK